MEMEVTINTGKYGNFKYLFAAVVLLVLSGCGGGGGGGSDDGGVIGTGVALKGTAATGNAIANSTVTVKSKTGSIQSATTDANGHYEITALADNGPYLIRVDNGNEDPLFSIGHKGSGQSITRNLHPYTDLIIRNWFTSQGLDIDAAFVGTAAISSMPSAQQVDAIENEVNAIMSQVLTSHGLAADIDLLSTPFNANGAGFDQFLDNSQVVINNSKITVVAIDQSTNIQNIVINNINLGKDLTSASDTAPTMPGNLRALPGGATEIVVVWDASTDDKGVAGYNVHRNGQLVGTTPFPVYRDTGLNQFGAYSYEVEAIDGRGQVSVRTQATPLVSLITPDTTPPPVATQLQASAVGNRVNLGWTQSQIDDVVGFRVLRGAQGNANTLVATVTSTDYIDWHLVNGTNYCYRIKTYDAAGNESAASAETCVSIGGVVPVVSTLGFSSATYQVQESASSVSITVNRMGNISEAVSVDYRAENGTAIAGEDFVAINGTLSWAANDSVAKTFTVQITSDSVVEGDETVQLTLSNPSANTSLSNTPAATLSIVDAGAVACNATLDNRSITVDTILSEPCYQVPNGIWVESPATLSISPGVRLEFGAGTELLVRQGAALSAVGTLAQPVTFTGIQRTPGYWDGIELQSNSLNNKFEYAVVENGVININLKSSLYPARVSIKNSTLRHAQDFGFYFRDTSIIDHYESVTATSNGAPGKLPDNLVSKLGNDSQYTGNTDDRLHVYWDEVVDAQIWRKLDVPYFMSSENNRYYIRSHLTLEAGTKLIFSSGSELYVTSTGALTAVGTSNDPVVFTAEQQSPGHWDGINFTYSNSLNNQLIHTVVEYGVTNVLLNTGSTVPARITVENTILRYAQNYGFDFDRYSIVESFTGVSSTGNGVPGRVDANHAGSLGGDSHYVGNNDDQLHVRLTGNYIVEDQIWHKLDVPYYMSNQSTYGLQAHLTIEPGTVLSFASGADLMVWGANGGMLTAVGTVAEPIVFTGAEAVAGYWDGIRFFYSNSVNNQLVYSIIEYGGGDAQPSVSANIKMTCASNNPSRLSLSNSIVRNSLGWGVIRNDAGCAFTDTNNTYSANAEGNVK